jgi:uncharacterized protein YjbI with pentapeptide repeats
MNVALPQLSQDLLAATDPRSSIEGDEPLVGARIEDCDLANIKADGVRFSEVSLTRVSLASAALEKLDWSDVLAGQCDFTAADCEQSSWRRVLVKSWRMQHLKIAS